MTTNCVQCKKRIDTEHDSFGFCSSCGKKTTIRCAACALDKTKCSICGTTMQHREESITKKTFFNPVTRGGLGW